MRNVLKAFIAKSSSNKDAIDSLNACESYCKDDVECWGCSIQCKISDKQCQWNAIPTCGRWINWDGKIEGDITYKASKSSKYINWIRARKSRDLMNFVSIKPSNI